MKNIAIAGGLLLLAAWGPGALSMDAKRPRRRHPVSAQVAPQLLARFGIVAKGALRRLAGLFRALAAGRVGATRSAGAMSSHQFTERLCDALTAAASSRADAILAASAGCIIDRGAALPQTQAKRDGDASDCQRAEATSCQCRLNQSLVA